MPTTSGRAGRGNACSDAAESACIVARKGGRYMEGREIEEQEPIREAAPELGSIGGEAAPELGSIGVEASKEERGPEGGEARREGKGEEGEAGKEGKGEEEVH